jgi:short-subunit dehydrogenase
MKLNKFEHKNILITGASSGIGQAMAYRLAEAKTNLFLTGRHTARLLETARKCEAIHEASSRGVVAGFRDPDFSVQTFPVDLLDISRMDGFLAGIAGKEIRFDYVILNAGVSQRAPALETDFSVDRTIMGTNYFGPVYLIKRLLERSLPGKTLHIAVTSSIAGLFGFPLRSAYCASKHALFGFFESLELENDAIKVTFLIPGRIRTPISQNALLGNGAAYSEMDRGQADGMDADKCARIALRAISKEKRRQLIGGKELLMVYIRKYLPPLFYILARKVSAI